MNVCSCIVEDRMSPRGVHLLATILMPCDQLVNGSMLGCWLQVAGVLVTYWLPGYLLLVTGLLVTWLSGYYLLPGRRKNQFPIAYWLLR